MKSSVNKIEKIVQINVMSMDSIDLKLTPREAFLLYAFVGQTAGDTLANNVNRYASTSRDDIFDDEIESNSGVTDYNEATVFLHNLYRALKTRMLKE